MIGADEAVEAVTPEAAAHALWIWANHHHPDQPEGIRPGSFSRALFSAIDEADPTNRAKLRAAFPAEVAAHQLLTNHECGIDLLRQKFRCGFEKRPA